MADVVGVEGFQLAVVASCDDVGRAAQAIRTQGTRTS